MEDHKCVKQRVVQFDLGSYSNPVCTAAKRQEIGIRRLRTRPTPEDEHDLLFRYYYCPRVGATASTDVNLQIASVNGCLCYLQDGIADTFVDAACDGAPRSNKRRDARLVYVVGYFDRMGSDSIPRRALARRR
jgi:hypothetical protein